MKGDDGYNVFPSYEIACALSGNSVNKSSLSLICFELLQVDIPTTASITKPDTNFIWQDLSVTNKLSIYLLSVNKGIVNLTPLGDGPFVSKP